eukprot:CAMPEP_0181125462 /NCGR_PEP_ID=MMETSP1071-20121207/27064_1 /TAXON_ID=35127 /ORGANISM="Thalassiosira sp., Strain NH16" /LENGTH=759 /DNA_ID=CAMNT_0023210909 /DNA_START=46 /DNA_END=2325 /DNA_ORIENTATION=+
MTMMTPANSHRTYSAFGSSLTVLLLSSIAPVARSSNIRHAPCPGGLKCHHGGECATGDKDHSLDHPLITSDLPWLEETNVNGEHCINCHDGWGGVACSRHYQKCDAHDPHAPTCFNGAECRKMGISATTGMYEYSCDCTTAGLDEDGDVKYAGKYCQHLHEEKCGFGDEEMFCTNGGKCVIVPGSSVEDEILSEYSVCECPDHRAGTHCEFLKEEGFTDCRLECERGTCAKGFKSYDDLIGTGPFPAQLAFDIISDTGEHCVCPPGYTGLRCEIQAEKCGPDKYCYNGSTCRHDETGTPMCDCNSAHTNEVSYAGSSCEQEGSEYCEPGLDQDQKDAFCTKHGRCINDPDARHMGCTCDEGWSGDLCDIEGDKEPVCDLDCQNEGSCRFGMKGYKDSYDALGLPVHAKKSEKGMYCSCPSGFTGLKCEVDMNHCHIHDGTSDHFCLNGVPCNPDNPAFEGIEKSFSCKCDEGQSEVTQMLTGRFCEYAVTEFCSQDLSRHSNSFCTNGGNCKELNRRGDSEHHGCCCPVGYEGEHCQFPVGTLDESTPVTWSPFDECAKREEPSIPKNIFPVAPNSDDSGNGSFLGGSSGDSRDGASDGSDLSSYISPSDTKVELPILEAAAPEEEDSPAEESNGNTGGIVSGILVTLLVAAVAGVAYHKRLSANDDGDTISFNADWWTGQHTIEWWKGDPDSPVERDTNIAPASLARGSSVESNPGCDNMMDVARQWSYPGDHAMSSGDDVGEDKKWECIGDLQDVVI